GEQLPISAARRVGDGPVRLEHLGAHVRGREVVGRVVGDLPNQDRADRVGHQLAAEVGADPLLALLDPKPSAAPGGLGRSAHAHNGSDAASLEAPATVAACGVRSLVAASPLSRYRDNDVPHAVDGGAPTWEELGDRIKAP